MRNWWVREHGLAWRLHLADGRVWERRGPLHGAETLVEWGSVTKPVTAALAHLLAAAGVVDLAAPVAHYLPAAPLPPQVTLARLVDHTSGLPAVPPDIGWQANPWAKYTPAYFDAHVVPRLGIGQTLHVGRFSYSNLGYAVLTRALEVAAGASWPELVQREIFGPWGIGGVTTVHLPGRVAVLHDRWGRVREQWQDTGPFVGAGGLLSPLAGLTDFARGVARHLPSMPGWIQVGDSWWHNGQNRDHGAYVEIRPGRFAIAVHTVGHRPWTADRLAARLLEKLDTLPADAARVDKSR